MEFRVHKIPDASYEAFRDAARYEHISVNSLFLRLIEKTAKEWKKGEEARILKAADEIRQKRLL